MAKKINIYESHHKEVCTHELITAANKTKEVFFPELDHNDNPSVDLHEYVSINDGFDFFFYLSVHGEVLSGTAIPVDEAKQQPSSYSPTSNETEIDVISPIIGKSNDPVSKGEDTIYIFLDTNPTVQDGFKVNNSFYANKVPGPITLF